MNLRRYFTPNLRATKEAKTVIKLGKTALKLDTIEVRASVTIVGVRISTLSTVEKLNSYKVRIRKV